MAALASLVYVLDYLILRIINNKDKKCVQKTTNQQYLIFYFNLNIISYLNSPECSIKKKRNKIFGYKNDIFEKECQKINQGSYILFIFYPFKYMNFVINNSIKFTTLKRLHDIARRILQ